MNKLIAPLIFVMVCSGFVSCASREKSQKKMSLRDQALAEIRQANEVPLCWESIDDASAVGFIHQFAAKVVQGRISRDVQWIRTSDSDKLIAAEVFGNGAGAGKDAGIITMTSAVPSDYAVWMAVADLFRNHRPEKPDVVEKRGYGVFLHTIRDDTRKLQLDDLERTVRVTTDSLSFRVSPAVVCTSEFSMLAGSSAYVSPADAAIAALIKKGVIKDPEEKRAQFFGILEGEVGAISLIQQVPGDSSGEYVLTARFDFDVASLFGFGGATEHVLVCRSPGPMFASQLENYAFARQRQESGEYRYIATMAR